MAILTLEQANSILPQQKTLSIIQPNRYKYLWIGPPKWGKTTTACSIPDSILLAFEEGHAFTETFKIIIDCWDRPFKEKQEGVGEDEDGNLHMSLAEAVDLICASDRFQHVVFDTADMAAKMCVDYWCKQLKVSHPADAGDFGKGFALTLGDPFRRMIGPLIKSGRGLSFITHTKWVERKIGKETIGKWESSLPNQVQGFLHTQADLILHGRFGKHRKGEDERDRIVSLDASEGLIAGSRVRIGGKPWPIPKNFILDPNDGWAQWAGFFPTDNTDEARKAALLNCEQEYARYLDLVVGKKAIETETAVALEAEEQSPAPAEAEKAGEEPASNGTPRKIVRHKGGLSK